MRSTYLILILIYMSNMFCQLPPLSLWLGRVGNNAGSYTYDYEKNKLYEPRTCVDYVKVGNESPDACVYGDVWYPVIYEEFNNTEEMLNNYSYKMEWTDNEGGGTKKTWMGGGIANGNFYCQNGELILENKKQHVSVGSGTYELTGAVLRSLYKTRLGIYIAHIKFPNNIYMWLAFWTHYGSFANHDYEEIDWCEFFDNCPSSDNAICNKGGRYSWMRMNILNKEPDGSNFCSRYAHIDMGNNYFNNYHIFGGYWTDYRIEFQTDYVSRGIATKFSATNFLSLDLCDISRPYYPIKSCYNMMYEPECLVEGPFGWWCNVWNWVYKDVYFPHRAQQVLITCQVNSQEPPDKGKCSQSAYDGAINNWDNFSFDARVAKIDYLVIYQPVKCNSDYTVLNESQYRSITGGTNFLSGRKIKISNGVSANTYVNESPKSSNNWHEFPTHILATEEIAFLSETIFEEGTFLRAEIIDCNQYGISNFSQRLSGENKNFPVLPIDYFEQDSLAAIYSYPGRNGQLVSETDNGALQLFPNPASDKFFISVNEEDWYDLSKIELVNVLGQVVELPKAAIQDYRAIQKGCIM